MSARDKLAEIINEYMEVDIPESVPDKHIPTGADYGLADEIIEAGWRPPARVITTVEELEALPNNEERAIPQEAVEAAAFALDGHSWMTDNEVSLCACGEVLKPSLEYAGDAYRSHLAELALAAALPAIEKEIRAQVAVEMERRADEYLESANQFGGYYLGVKSAFQDAARIAEARTDANRAIAAHDAELREQIAREIEVHMRHHDNAQIGFSAVGDAYADAARIARGKAS